ncbi:MAG: PDZ domain-containing protein [Burkholderiaceae bacterium]
MRMVALNSALVALIMNSGCALAPKPSELAASALNGGGVAPARTTRPQRQIRIAYETTTTTCMPPVNSSRPAGTPRAFFGLFAQMCQGAVPGDPISRLIVVGFDEMAGQSPARDAGLRVGDVVTGFNGCPLADAQQLHERMNVFVAGHAAELTLLRRDGVTFSRATVLVPTLKLAGRTLPPKGCRDAGLAQG